MELFSIRIQRTFQLVSTTNVKADQHNLFVLYPYFYKKRELSFSFFGSLMYYSYICSAKITHE